jgi:uncharacterized membrane protein HdeD (DUF308 family)
LSYVQAAVSDWAKEANRNAGWIVMLGVLMVITGLLSIASPMLSGLGVTLFVGIALIIGGIARTIGVFHSGSFGQGALALIGGVLTSVAGVVLATRPGIGLATLTLALGAYLLLDGVSGAILAFRMRPASGWGWLLFSACATVVVGILLLREWPLSGVWAIGTMLGIHLLFSGGAIISIGSAARSITKRLA